jgi:hypothetical protein
MIFGIPISLIEIPFLYSVFNMQTKFLNYFPNISKEYTNENIPLTSTLLKFDIDWLTEYQNIGDENKLIDTI